MLGIVVKESSGYHCPFRIAPIFCYIEVNEIYFFFLYFFLFFNGILCRILDLLIAITLELFIIPTTLRSPNLFLKSIELLCQKEKENEGLVAW